MIKSSWVISHINLEQISNIIRNKSYLIPEVSETLNFCYQLTLLIARGNSSPFTHSQNLQDLSDIIYNYTIRSLSNRKVPVIFTINKKSFLRKKMRPCFPNACIGSANWVRKSLMVLYDRFWLIKINFLTTFMKLI